MTMMICHFKKDYRAKIKFYRTHPVECAEDLLNIKLTWLQKKIINTEKGIIIK